MVLRGPCRSRGAAQVKDLCFQHDPRCGQLCADAGCQKEHLDTLQEADAERLDRALQAWQTRKKKSEKDACAKESGVPDRCDILMKTPCSMLRSDLPLPPGLFEVPWYYDMRWHQRAMSAQLISSCSFLAHSSLWSCIPRLRRYREIHPDQRPIFAAELGRLCGRSLPHRGVLCVEKPYLQGFVEGLAETVTVEFILLAVNGGDAPLTLHQQACFAMNLHTALDARFFPLPIGLPHHCDGLHRGNLRAASDAEALISQCKAEAKPWHLRDGRLLVTPMQASRLRTKYVERLSLPEFRELVRVVPDRLDFASFMRVLADHQAVLSPPGKGHDCYRTWQALAVGTVPLVVLDPLFDGRLYMNAGLQIVGQPEELTPELLAALLMRLEPPDGSQVEVTYWLNHWQSVQNCGDKSKSDVLG
ncbi:unnamed protein product [Durusdinium trenchii]|uniref:Exostosin GT47 domain-containing protein n=1 Tax=Durusdinium trenchii TaxID=1381693 RepID=A0ABP0SWI3_9DINO